VKRFYTGVATIAGADGWHIELDGRPVRTPARALLEIPTAALALGIADEWAAQGEEIVPQAMPFTGLANAAIDQVAPNRATFAADIAAYGGSDHLCYRAEAPAALVARQAAAWDPLLDWAMARYDIGFRVTQGIVHIPQPPETLARLSSVVAAFDPFTLAGLSTLVALSGSLVCGLALVDGGYDADAVWGAAEIDEAWQVEQWGADAEAAARSARRSRDFSTARAFCAMARA
jgi:chaperone required for assembly of F1-ATPase